MREREKERGSEGERERVYMFVHECTVWSFSFGFTMKSGGRGGYLILHCHQKNYAVLSVTLSPPKLCCVKMGSVVNNFNISLMVRGNVAKSPYPAIFEGKGELKQTSTDIHWLTG